MRELIFFESYGTVVVGIKFSQVSDKVLRFKLVTAIDYPAIDHDNDGNEVATVNYFNVLGQDSEVVEGFEDGALLAAGQFVMQYPDDKENPIVFTIEFFSGVIYNGIEFKDLSYLISNHITAKAFLFLSGKEFSSVERVEMDFANV